jgi:hypothetical protein
LPRLCQTSHTASAANANSSSQNANLMRKV